VSRFGRRVLKPICAYAAAAYVRTVDTVSNPTLFARNIKESSPVTYAEIERISTEPAAAERLDPLDASPYKRLVGTLRVRNAKT
jgi:hypothetical protein